MSATVDGESWAATASVQAGFSNGILAFAGTDANNVTLAIALAPTGAGTYPIAPGQPTNVSYSITGGQAKVWQAVTTNGSGSVGLDSLTASGAFGTFHFEIPAVAATGATGTKSVTDGKFAVKF